MSEKKIVLNIGTELEIDPVAGFRAFICASSGYGKSYLAAKITEEMLEKNFLIVIFDTEGEYHTLRTKYNLLVIGRDVPLDIDSADIYAELLLKKSINLIFDFAAADLSDFEAQMFFAKFTETVFQLESKYRKPVIFIVEEAKVYAPQRGNPESLIPANKISKRGRKRGIHSIWITQRPADFNKMILSQCNVIFVGRVIHERDIKALEPYVGQKNVDRIRYLEPNEKILVQNEKSVVFRVAQRKTPHGADTPLVPLAQKSHELKNVASELVAMLSKKQREREKEKSEIEKLKLQVKALQEKLKEKDRKIEKLKTALIAKEAILASIEVKTQPIKLQTPIEEEAKTVAVAVKKTRQDIISSLPKYEQKILQFLARYPFLEFTKSQIARGVGFSKKSSRFNKAISRLLQLNLIDRIVNARGVIKYKLRED